MSKGRAERRGLRMYARPGATRRPSPPQQLAPESSRAAERQRREGIVRRACRYSSLLFHGACECLAIEAGRVEATHPLLSLCEHVNRIGDSFAPRCILLGRLHPMNPVNPCERRSAIPGGSSGRVSVQEGLEFLWKRWIWLFSEAGESERCRFSDCQCFLLHDDGRNDEPMSKFAVRLHLSIEALLTDGYACGDPAPPQMGFAEFRWYLGEQKRLSGREVYRA